MFLLIANDFHNRQPFKKKALNLIELKKEIIQKYKRSIKIGEIDRMYGKSLNHDNLRYEEKEIYKGF